jgi:hypothetical protein
VFEKAGYYSVWAMAFGLIGLDIILRLVMVERKIAVRWDSQYEPKRAETSSGEQQIVAKQLDEKAEGTESDDDKKNDPLSESDNDHVNEAGDSNTRDKWYNRLPPVLKLLASRRLLSALWAVLIQSCLLTSFDSVLPLFTKNTFGWNATGAGLIFLPIVVPTFIGPFIGHLSDKQGPRWYATAGFVGGCPFLILLRLVDHDSLRQKVLLCALLALIGFFLILAITPVMAEVTYAVMDKESRRPKGYYGENGAYAQAYSWMYDWTSASWSGRQLRRLANGHSNTRLCQYLHRITSGHLDGRQLAKKQRQKHASRKNC